MPTVEDGIDTGGWSCSGHGTPRRFAGASGGLGKKV